MYEMKPTVNHEATLDNFAMSASKPIVNHEATLDNFVMSASKPNVATTTVLTTAPNDTMMP